MIHADVKANLTILSGTGCDKRDQLESLQFQAIFYPYLSNASRPSLNAYQAMPREPARSIIGYGK